MTKAKDAHVVFNMKKQVMECLHCKQSYPMSFPVPMGLFSDMMKSWQKSHRRCEKPKDDNDAQ